MAMIKKYGTYVEPRRSLLEPRAFVGVHNEPFLHHRRRGRSNRGCRVLGSTPLNKEFDTTKSVLFNVLDTWLEPARFYADVQYVIALRMMRLALGGSPAVTEVRQMVSEKVFALNRRKWLS